MEDKIDLQEVFIPQVPSKSRSLCFCIIGIRDASIFILNYFIILNTLKLYF